MTHSPEPWQFADYEEIIDSEGLHVINGDHDNPRWPDVPTCERIVACVNACAGIPTEGLKQMSVADLVMYGRQILEHPSNVTAVALSVAHSYIMAEVNLKEDAEGFEDRLHAKDDE